MERIERITQISNIQYNQLRFGYAINYIEQGDTFYFDPSYKTKRKSGGWSKDRWLNLTTKFRLTFIYDS